MDIADLRAKIEEELATKMASGMPAVQAALEAVMKFHPRNDTLHCPTCQCNRLHPDMPVDLNGKPRSRSWHHN